MKILTGMLCSLGCGEVGVGYYSKNDVIHILCYQHLMELEKIALEHDQAEALDSMRFWGDDTYYEEG